MSHLTLDQTITIPITVVLLVEASQSSFSAALLFSKTSKLLLSFRDKFKKKNKPSSNLVKTLLGMEMLQNIEIWAPATLRITWNA